MDGSKYRRVGSMLSAGFTLDELPRTPNRFQAFLTAVSLLRELAMWNVCERAHPTLEALRSSKPFKKKGNP